MKPYLFIINPVSGGHAGDLLRHRLLQEVKTRLPSTAYDILLSGPGGFRIPVPDSETVVVAGGDGTVWQTVQKIMQQPVLPRIGVVPVGTGNDLARSLGVCDLLRSCGVAGVLDAVQQGKTAPLDVLRLNSDIFFTNYYGLGSDAAVARDINAFRQKYAGKRREALLHGRVLYFLAGLRRLGHRLRAPVEISYEDAQGRQSGQTAAPDCRQIVVTNIASYAGGAQPSSQCRMDDGLFEVTVVGSARQWMLLHLTRFFKTPIDRVLPGIIRFQARSLTLGWSGRLCCQVDGETFGAQEPAPPHTITVAGRVEVIVP